jgi:hypothetical protein
MNEKEIEIVANSIRKNGKLIAKDKAKTKSFLKKIGILNKKSGKVTNAYREICIPIGQD